LPLAQWLAVLASQQMRNKKTYKKMTHDLKTLVNPMRLHSNATVLNQVTSSYYHQLVKSLDQIKPPLLRGKSTQKRARRTWVLISRAGR